MSECIFCKRIPADFRPGHNTSNPGICKSCLKELKEALDKLGD
ncbi:MAG: hypothetical protein AABY22_23485 [Nanoarchaeota archaeon]